MEKRKILVEAEKTEYKNKKDNQIKMIHKNHMLYIGDMPQLVVDLETQENYIICKDGKIPYYREITLSNDLLQGKRKNVLNTALRHYYTQACEVVRGKQIAAEYRRIKQK